MVMVGFDKGSPEEKIVMRWLSERYHAPSDDVKQPVDMKAAGEFDALVAKLVERVANRDERPRLEKFVVLQTVRAVTGRSLNGKRHASPSNETGKAPRPQNGLPLEERLAAQTASRPLGTWRGRA